MPAFLPLDGEDHADCLRSLYALVREAGVDDAGSSVDPGDAEQCGPMSSTGAILAALSSAAAKMPERSARRGRSAA